MPAAADLRYPKPLRHELSEAQLEEVLLWCADAGASDIVFCPEDPVWMQRHGVWRRVTDTRVTDAEVQAVVNFTSGQSNRAGWVRSGHSMDYAFSVHVPGKRTVRQRFRVNATASIKGVYAVMRVLPRSLPLLSDMHLPEDLERALFPEAGLVVISGVMGSGKSTLLAAVLHRAALDRGVGRQILTLEEPVEFDFSGLPAEGRAAPITQSEVGCDVRDWAAGVRTLTRRKAEIVMVGECRDRETISSLLSTVEQGVTAYTTVHAQDVPQTLARITHLFPEDE
ncbi:MAG: ATPase, T2SS/T4P/T4SS family, partial [Desulfovibrionaceae bacterium]|nr:ATPase, T2SS/T4P/T4SS family [Desulfovibrionaceae bacterium]